VLDTEVDGTNILLLRERRQVHVAGHLPAKELRDQYAVIIGKAQRSTVDINRVGSAPVGSDRKLKLDGMLRCRSEAYDRRDAAVHAACRGGAQNLSGNSIDDRQGSCGTGARVRYGNGSSISSISDRNRNRVRNDLLRRVEVGQLKNLVAKEIHVIG